MLKSFEEFEETRSPFVLEKFTKEVLGDNNRIVKFCAIWLNKYKKTALEGQMIR